MEVAGGDVAPVGLEAVGGEVARAGLAGDFGEVSAIVFGKQELRTGGCVGVSD